MNVFRIAAAILAAALTLAVAADAGENVPVYLVRIDDGALGADGMIDYWLVRFLGRTVKEAKNAGAEVIILEIETNGGMSNAALRIAGDLGDSGLRTIAFVRNRAFSAGALITYACQEIYVQEGSSMGGATPYLPNPQGGVIELPKAIEEKNIRSFVSAFRSTAKRNGHNEALAAAMVDPELEVVEAEIDGERRILLRREFREEYLNNRDVREISVVVKAGEIFVPTASDAVRYGIARGQVKSRDELLAVLAFTENRIVEVRAGWLDNAARFLASPFASGLIILLAVIGLGVELKTPGFGAGGSIFILSLCVFLWTKFLAGTATPLEIALFFVGVALLAVELLLIPGFGVVGIAGIVVMVGSLILTALGPDTFSLGGAPSIPMPSSSPLPDIASVAIPMALGVVIILILVSTMDKLPFARKLVLAEESNAALAGAAPSEDGTTVQPGAAGRARTPLRPAGRAEIAGRVVDVVTNGGFIGEGAEIVVLEISGNRIVVQEAQPGSGEEAS
ncbi:MAG: hypothetical protein JW909_08850 [Planctomycetes bacterium]|nr:hypothetical protein [Planctomycetota bacterium]